VAKHGSAAGEMGDRLTANHFVSTTPFTFTPHKSSAID